MNMRPIWLLLIITLLPQLSFSTPMGEYEGIPVFLGYTGKAAGTLKAIRDIAEFRQVFGSPHVPTRVGKRQDAIPDFLLDHSLQLFWANGGQKAYVLSVGTYAHEGQSPQAIHFSRAFKHLKTDTESNIILMPFIVRLPMPDYLAVCQAALSHASRHHQFVILDVKSAASGDTQSSLSDFRNGIGNQHLSYGAAYWPYLRTQLPISPSGGRTILPPSPAVAGRMTETDRTKGVWKAPAGISLSSVIEPLQAIPQAETGDMNTHTSGLSINPIKSFSGRGILIWGARTLAGNDNEWRYVPVRRFASLLELSSIRLTEFAKDQANTAATWQQIKTILTAHLQELFRKGAFAGSKSEHAYFVKVGLDETMSAHDVSQGRIIIQIGFAPLKPAEFVVLRLELQN